MKFTLLFDLPGYMLRNNNAFMLTNKGYLFKFVVFCLN